ncbi:MAG: glutamate-1-semialdehyde 2,1-aminomutase [Cytophagales bacterium]|nr:glutamate-1-semialdehyde 2,1-aminomutase [Cytophagales bacterium]
MSYSITKSKSLFDRAQQHIPGGVNSPVRAFKSVGGTPLFIQKAKGAYLYDEDGNQYIDYINSWGPMILGHAYQPVVDAIIAKAADSTSFGAPTELEIDMAELIKQMAPAIDLVRMVNSGTEACMSAVRLARGYTGRNKIIKFEGCYHGHADAFLVKAGSGVATLNIQSVPGVQAHVAEDTLTAPYNDMDSVMNLISQHPNEIAAIIIEPVAGNMGCILPAEGYLKSLREVCTQQGIILIFDEVMTGFRLARGGAQEVFGIEADLVTFGKIIGGGLPVGAFGGKKAIMEKIAPLGAVYQAGTLSGNPIAMTAGYTLLKQLNDNPSIYAKLDAKAKLLCEGIHQALEKKGIDHRINQLGSMMSVHFCSHEVKHFEDAKACDNSLFNKFFHHMLTKGIYLPPSAFESWFICTALSDSDIQKTVDAVLEF